MPKPSDLLQGTLDLLILRVLVREAAHGCGEGLVFFTEVEIHGSFLFPHWGGCRRMVARRGGLVNFGSRRQA